MNPVKENETKNIEKFKDYPLDNNIKKALSELGFKKPLEVQAKVIPMILAGKDLIVKSQTGSGKTAAFAIPLCQKIDVELESPQVLVLTPTRELTVQVKEDMTDIGKYTGLKFCALHGNQPMELQRKELKQKPHVIVATPGRMMDHLKNKNVKLQDIKYLVIDEADEMLIMGFKEQIETILKKVPKERVTLLFSATMPDEINYLSREYMNNPENIDIESKVSTFDKIEQIYYAVDGLKKVDFMKKVIEKENPRKAIMFCNTQEQVDNLFEIFKKWDRSTCAVHGGMDQKIRTEKLNAFKKGEYRMLIATDVAARGLHVQGVTHIINYGVPFEPENYIHRIGRTGRVDEHGIAITMVIPSEMERFKALETFLGYEIPCKGGHVDKRQKAESKNQNNKERFKPGSRNGQKALVQFMAGRDNSVLKTSDFLAAVRNVNGVYNEDIGKVDIKENITTVEIFDGKESLVINALKTKKIKGKVYRVKKGERQKCILERFTIMKIAIIHGYFLNGTGSNLYVQNLCRQFCKMGHDVLLFCQERTGEKYDFIESAYLFDKTNEHLELIHEKATPYVGKCTCYIPAIGRILPVYVKDRYEGFDAEEITQLSEKDLENYISYNEKALKTIFANHKPDIVISNHTVMQPVYVKRALEDFNDVFIFTVVHGSCLNFSVKKSALALRYAIEGLNVTDKLVFLTDYSMQEFSDFFQGRAEFKAEKILIPAGVDIEKFIPLEKGTSKNARIHMLLKKAKSEYGNSMGAESEYGNCIGEEFEYGNCMGEADYKKTRDFDKFIKEASADKLSEIKTQLMEKGDKKSIDSDIKGKLLNIDWEKDNILLYYGKYLWTKGIHNLILSLPFVLQNNPDTRLILVGFGTSRGYLEAIVGAMDAGDLKKLRHLLTFPQDFQSHVENGTEIYSGYILDMLEDIERSRAYFEKTIGIISDKVIFTGFMDHNLLKDIISCADIAIAPSIFPEAFGLVGVEALACGVFPLQPYHSGFKSVVDSYSELFELDDKFNALGKLWLDEDLVKNIAIQINTILAAYKKQGSDLNEKVKSTARKICIDHYSWDSVALKFLSAFRKSVK